MPDLYTRAEAATQLKMSDRTLRKLIAGVTAFAGRRVRTLTAEDLRLIREADECRSMSRAVAPVSGTRAAQSGRVVKVSPSRNDPRDAVRELTRKPSRLDGTGMSATNSSKVRRPRS